MARGFHIKRERRKIMEKLSITSLFVASGADNLKTAAILLAISMISLVIYKTKEKRSQKQKAN